jgi:hypothetical protein
VPEVGAALNALAHEADALRMPDRTIVEPVGGELEPVVAELQEQVLLEESRRVVRDTTAAKVGMDCEASEPRNSVRLAPLFESHRAGARTVAFDDEPAEPLRLARRPFDLGGDAIPVEGTPGAEERLRLLAVEQVDEPVDVFGGGPADRDFQAVTCGMSASSGS